MSPPALLEALQPDFAEAYATAARAGANMRRVTDSLESLREALKSNQDVFVLWNAFDEQLGRAGLGAFQPAMTTLHRNFERSLTEQLLCAVTGASEPAEDALQWLLLAARCFGDGNWRDELFTALVNANLPAIEQFESPFCEHTTLHQLAYAVATGRWPETSPTVTSCPSANNSGGAKT